MIAQDIESVEIGRPKNIVSLIYDTKLLYVRAVYVPEGSHSYRFEKNWQGKMFWYTDKDGNSFYYCMTFHKHATMIGEICGGNANFDLIKPNQQSNMKMYFTKQEIEDILEESGIDRGKNYIVIKL